MWASDIEPQLEGIHKNDYLDIGEEECSESEFIITNPPWNRNILHPMIDYCRQIRPTWLLFDADWMHTKQARPYLFDCKKIVSIGRVKWFGDTTGKDNCAWYLFTNEYKPLVATEFYGRN